MFISRQIDPRIKELSHKFPVISVTGPRQSGKTTLLRKVFPDYTYVSLENPDEQRFALDDPRGFLQRYDRYVILDEAQRAPQLFNYLQGKVDEDGLAGQYILSGSQNYLLMERITQSLAGRVALFKLFPFTFSELNSVNRMPPTPEQAIFKGFYPRIYDKDISPGDFYPNYFESYIERDVRLLTVVQDLTLFRKFVQLCAGRTGQLLNYQALAADTGISPVTAKAWVGILEAGHIIFLLPPYYRNFAKRIRKAPKLYFYDTGLACHLLGIADKHDAAVHFAKGQLFENLVIAEIRKQHFHTGWTSDCYFWQDSNRREIDLLMEKKGNIIAAEIKSGATINPSFFDNLMLFQKYAGSEFDVKSYLIYSGTKSLEHTFASVRGWLDLEGIF